VADLAGKVALVTGGAGGLGRATVRALAAAGAEVVVADVDEENGRAAAEEAGGHFVATDTSDLAANQAMVDFAVDRCGGLDLVHLNAGVMTGTMLGDGFDPERYRRANAINLDGVVYGTQAALGALRARGGGSIVATASLAGLVGIPLDPVYTANKHAVVGFARAMGELLAPEGIRFNAVCPGFAESAIIEPIRDHIAGLGLAIIPAEKVADAVVELLGSDAAGECWVIQPGRDPIPFEFRRVPGPR
jgi:NAD(P)-dependent dehydrogenase (short-subunit alcohol dehydrogenase family)